MWNSHSTIVSDIAFAFEITFRDSLPFKEEKSYALDWQVQ